MSNFAQFKSAVQAQINLMSAHQLFVSNASRDSLWETYLESFPAGTNNIYRERREYDCNCCRQFVRQAGGMLAIIDNKLVSIWDIQIGGYYQPVVDALAKLVKETGIDTIFLHYENSIGIDKNHEMKDGVAHTWEHFYTKLPTKAIARGDVIATKQGKAKTNTQCFERSVREITTEAIEVCLDLIAQNAIYRGEEFLKTVKSLQQFKREYLAASNQTAYVWEKSMVMGDASNIRGSAIGTLLVDLSEGVDLEAAVKSFEAKVAPQNYKRSSALITQKMIDEANKTVVTLGLEPAFHRRFANLQDITINNVLFADRSVAPAIGGLMSSLSPTATTNLKLDQVAEMSYQDFIEKILPTAVSVDVFVENRHESNLVSLIAPVFNDTGSILKWGNNFSWSYNGEVTDAIKERVKAAGGSVEGVLCVRLSWDATDDLDLHVYEPNGDHVYYATRGRRSSCGGMLDVDANGGSGMMANPVENIFYKDASTMKNGDYVVKVHNYNQRSGNQGFELQVECEGTTYNYSHPERLRDSQKVDVAVITYTNGKFEVTGDFTKNTAVKEFWGLTSGQFQPVHAVMFSPNHWDGECTGNKHVFFMLKDCVNPDQARGFYNEFLSENLNQHRKVFEVLSSKMKTPQNQDQLSGLGFSTTKKDHVVCRVTGSFNRTIKVTF